MSKICHPSLSPSYPPGSIKFSAQYLSLFPGIASQLDSSGRKGKWCPSFLSFHSSALTKARRRNQRPATINHHPKATSPSDCVSFFVLPSSENRSWGGVLILKLRCHLRGIRNGNRMPASGNRVKRRITWMSSSSPPAEEFVIVSANNERTSWSSIDARPLHSFVYPHTQCDMIMCVE